MGKLTAVKIRSLSEPGRYADGDGLFLNINGKGSGNWMLRSQAGGRRRDIGLGSLKLISLAEARDAAFTIRKMIAKGVDPVAEREKERLVRSHFPGGGKAGSRRAREGVEEREASEAVARDARILRLPQDRRSAGRPDRRTADPRRSRAIWLSKPETARRVRQRIGAVLDWAYAKGLERPRRPCVPFPRDCPVSRKKDGHFAALPYAEVPAFLVTLRERESVGRLALEALILTAGRSGEIRGAAWSEVDLETGQWTVPRERMKMGRSHAVPFVPSGYRGFRARREVQGGRKRPRLPGQNVKKPLSDMTLLKILRDMELGVTVHGFVLRSATGSPSRLIIRARSPKRRWRTQSRTGWRPPIGGQTFWTNAVCSCATGRTSAKARPRTGIEGPGVEAPGTSWPENPDLIGYESASPSRNERFLRLVGEWTMTEPTPKLTLAHVGEE